MKDLHFFQHSRLWVSALTLAMALNIVVWGNFAQNASAHAHLKGATVAPQATLNKAPTAITLTFGEESDLQLTKIQVLDSKGIDMSSGPATVAPNDAKTWTVNLKADLADGTYTVKYHTLTDDDGGIVDGSYTFTLTSNGTVATGSAAAATEQETGANAPGAAPATGEGGAALAANNPTGGGLGLVSVLLALLLTASGLLFLRRRVNK